MTTFPLERISPLYAFLDPANPKRKKESELKALASRAAILVGGMDDLGRVFALHAWAARTSTDKLMDKVIDVSDRFKPKLFGAEQNGLAGLFSDAVMRDAKYRHLVVKLIGVTQPSNIEKDYRIRTTLQPLIANGRLFLLGSDPGMLELRKEITTFPMNPRKDLIDALASLCRLMPIRHARQGRNAEREQYLAYLRESGADPRLIADEMRRWDNT